MGCYSRRQSSGNRRVSCLSLGLGLCRRSPLTAITAPPILPWVAGANTALSRDGAKLRIAAIGANNPRATQIRTLAAGTYRLQTLGTADQGPGLGFSRVSTGVGLSGDIASFQVNGPNQTVDYSFTVAAGDYYIGFVVVCDADGQSGTCDYEFTLTKTA